MNVPYIDVQNAQLGSRRRDAHQVRSRRVRQGGDVTSSRAGLRFLFVGSQETSDALSRGLGTSRLDATIERTGRMRDVVAQLSADESREPVDFVVLDGSVSDSLERLAMRAAAGSGSGASLILLDRTPGRRLSPGGRIHAMTSAEFALMIGTTEPFAAFRPGAPPNGSASTARCIVHHND